MQYYLVVLKDYKLYNYRVHDLWRKMLKDRTITNLPCDSPNQVIQFIENNQLIPNKTLLIYHYQHPNNFILQILNHLNTYSNIQLRVFFFTFDYWYRADKPYTQIWKVIYNAKNHHVITFANNFGQLQKFHSTNIRPYKSHIHHFNLWCCYDTSFIPFNDNPINQIGVSGAMSVSYPERNQILKIPRVVRIPFEKTEVRIAKNAYNKRLHEYLCCFASSVHVLAMSPRRRINTHLVLLKFFEILACGALLLCPKSEEPYLNDIGLKSYTHYIAADNFQLVVEYILDPSNRNVIDQIRRNGQEFARKNFTSEQRYSQLKKLLEPE